MRFFRNISYLEKNFQQIDEKLDGKCFLTKNPKIRLHLLNVFLENLD